MPKFTILSRVDAYIDYTCEVEAEFLKSGDTHPFKGLP